MKLLLLTNGTFEEEEALINKESNILLLKGDYYHDKIEERIEGYLQCLRDNNIDYELEKEAIYPDNPLFKLVDFYNEEY